MAYVRNGPGISLGQLAMNSFRPTFLSKSLSPPFEKRGLGGILTSSGNLGRSNPPSPPFAKGGIERCEALEKCGAIFYKSLGVGARPA